MKRLSENFKNQVNVCVQGVCRIIIHKQYEILNTIYRAFLLHKKQLLKEGVQSIIEVRNDIENQRKNCIKSNLSKEETVRIDQIFQELDNIMIELVQILDVVTGKVDEGVLFSKKAVLEIEDIFMGMQEMFINLHDLTITQNNVLAQHILNKIDYLQEMIRNNNTEHEERLVTGICLPKSSILYIKMTEAMNEVINQVKIVTNIFTK